MSDAGRAATFRRWYRSDAGPRNQATRDAKAACSTCGYLMHLGGSARQLLACVPTNGLHSMVAQYRLITAAVRILKRT